MYCFVFVVATMIVVKTEGPSILCQTDEVGELCLYADYTGVSYWGLQGISSTTFQVNPNDVKCCIHYMTNICYDQEIHVNGKQLWNK